MKKDQSKDDYSKKGNKGKYDDKKSAKPYSERKKHSEEKEQPKKNFILGKKRLERKGERSNKTQDWKKDTGNKSERFSKKGQGKKTDTSANPDRKFSKSSRGRGEKPSYDARKIKSQRGSVPEKKDDLIRLNRYIANAGVCSRRDADLLIEAGEIKVNGEVITEMGHKVKVSDTVKYKDKVLSREKPVYILLNKPKNFITTTDDPEERKTVMHLVANACDERIYPVGRLDRNTTGLLLLTNDGDLAKKLSHPSHQVKKLYQVDLDKPLTDEDFYKVQDGVTLEDGLAKVDEIAIVNPERTIIGLELHVGRNRIVRRIFEHLGYEVTKLDRVMYAGLDKKDLPRGNWRFLHEKEVLRLKLMKYGPKAQQPEKNKD